MVTREPPEAEESLLSLAAPPLVWAAHFLLSYVTAALYCAKVASTGGPLGAARAAIVAYTALALVLLGWLGWRGHVRRRAPSEPTAELAAEGGSALARRRFLGNATLLLTCLSALAVLYGALVVVFVRSCR